MHTNHEIWTQTDAPHTRSPSRRWVTAAELADELGVSVFSVRRAVRAGRLLVKEILPGLRRIDRESVPTGPFSVRRV